MQNKHHEHHHITSRTSIACDHNQMSISNARPDKDGTSFKLSLGLWRIAIRSKPNAALLAVHLIVEAQNFEYKLQQLLRVFFVADQIIQHGEPRLYLWVHGSSQSDLEEGSEQLDALNAMYLTY